jgi:hypothetical protein
MTDYIRDLRPTEWGSRASLHGSNLEPPMSALGQKLTSKHVRVMSALPPKADVSRRVCEGVAQRRAERSHRPIGSAAPVFRRRATQCSLGRSIFQRDRLAGVN